MTLFEMAHQIHTFLLRCIRLLRHVGRLNPLRYLFFWKKLTKTQQRYWNAGLGALLIIFIPMAVYMLRNPGGAKAAWFDDNWSYRQTVTITNNGPTRSNYQVAVSVDTQALINMGKLQSQCQDLRFADGSGKALTYFLEYCSNSQTPYFDRPGKKSIVWVTIPHLPSAPSPIYMYYGNASAVSTSTSPTTTLTGINYGDGDHGTVTAASNTNLNTGGLSGRACSDGGSNVDAPNYSITSSVAAAATSLTLSTVPGAKCLNAGDEVLIITLQNGSTASTSANTGLYETVRLTATSSGTTLTLNRPLLNAYNGTVDKVMVQRIPNYDSVTVNAGVTVTGSAWDGTKGGVIAFRASGTVNLSAANARINAEGIGYRGGSGGAANEAGGQSGESYEGPASSNVGNRGGSGASNGEGRGGGRSGNGAANLTGLGADNRLLSAGGGGGGSDGSTNTTDGGGGGGGGGGNAGGGGGGGGSSDSASTPSQVSGTGGTGGSAGTVAGGGGGGCQDGNALNTPGAGGNAGSAGGDSASCTTNAFGGRAGTTGGLQGAGGSGPANVDGAGGGGGGGGLFGSSNLVSSLTMGGGGGGGGGADTGNAGGTGGNGGGIILIGANTLTLAANQAITASGSANIVAQLGGGAGGSGAGGSIYIGAVTATLGTTLIQNKGGAAISPRVRVAGGGAGGDGYVAVNYSTSTGSTNPTATTAILPVFYTLSEEESNPGPTLYWKFDEGSGTKTYDTTSTSNTGTLGGATLPTWQTEDVCVSGKCLYFDGSSSKVTGSKIVKNIQTVAFWIRPNATATQGIANLDGGTHMISTDGSSVVTATGFSSPTYYINGKATSTPTLIANQWNYVAITTATPFDATSSFTIGTDGTNFTKGFIDEVKFYPSARSATQIQSDFSSRGTKQGVSQNIGPDTSALSNGLVGYWKMDENTGTTITDSSGNSNTSSSFTGETAFTTGKYGSGLTFDGTNDVVRIPETTATDVGATNQSYTITGWIKTTTDSASAQILVGKDGGSGTSAFSLRLNNNEKANFLISDGTNSPSVINSGTATYNDGTWHFFVGVRDVTTDTLFLYVDGVLVGSTTDTTTTSVANNDDISIGNEGASYVARDLNGQVDEVRIYTRALSPADIANLYNFAPGPAGWWKLDEKIGSSAYDGSSNGNTATWQGTLGAQWTRGKFGGAGNLNGSDNYLSITNNAAFRFQNDFTISLWLNPGRTQSANANIIRKEPAAANTGYGIEMNGNANSNTYFAGWKDGAGNQCYASNSFSLTPATWQHVVIVKSGTTRSVYINGVFVNSCTGTSATVGDNTADLQIGNWTQFAGRYWNGMMDDVKLYNYARTQKQIVEDMNAGHPAPGSPIGSPVGYWKFDEGYGTTANNSGNCGRTCNGSMSGFASPATATSGWTNQGKYNKALNFLNGGTTYVEVPDSASTDITGALTISAWVQPRTSGSIVEKWDNTVGAAVSAYSLSYSGTVFTAQITDGATIKLVSSSTSIAPITNGNWYYVTMVYIPSTSLSIYINGKLANTPNTSGIFSSLNDTSKTLLIGAAHANAAKGNTLTGTIDEVKLYSAALTVDQIKSDMNQGHAQVMGAISTHQDTTTASNSASAEYCIPGDTTACAGPIGEWTFDEKAPTVFDKTGNANTGTWNGTSSKRYATGKQGAAGTFTNANNDYVDIANPSNFNFERTNSFSVSAWIRPNVTRTGSSVTMGIISKRVNTPAITGWELDFNWNDADQPNKSIIRFYMTNSAANGLLVKGSTDLKNGIWYHVSATYDGSSTAAGVKLYVNGVRETVTTVDLLSASIQNSTNLWIGHINSGSSDGFTGQIDQARVYNYVRTPAQVAWEYNRGGPILWWKMDECSGPTLNDMSGNANNGTFTIGAGAQTTMGTCTSPTDGSGVWYNGRNGKFGSSLNFSGTNDVIRFAETTPLDFGAVTDSYSLSAWVKTSNTAGVQYIIAKDNGSTPDPFALFFSGTQLACSLHDGSNSFTAGGVLNVNDGNWHMVTCVKDGSSTISLYVDGKPRGTVTSLATAGNSANNADISIGNGGASYTTNDFTGQIDDVRIYHYALTASQIRVLYNENAAIRYGPITGTP